jgi:hypothetical protein
MARVAQKAIAPPRASPSRHRPAMVKKKVWTAAVVSSPIVLLRASCRSMNWLIRASHSTKADAVQDRLFVGRDLGPRHHSVQRTGGGGVFLGQGLDRADGLLDVGGGREQAQVAHVDGAIVDAAAEIDRVSLLDRVDLVHGPQVLLDPVDLEGRDDGDDHRNGQHADEGEVQSVLDVQPGHR